MKNKSEKYLFFAEAGKKVGMGHLFRAYNLCEKIKIKDKSIFLYENQTQLNFYKKKKVFHRSLNNISNLKYKALFIDSKRNRKDILKRYDGIFNKLVLIDNETKLKNSANLIITPSYYSKSFKKKIRHGYHLSGFEYCILDKKINAIKRENSDEFLISFGGEDPNNLTLKTLFLLKKLNLNNRCKVVLGPNYSHDLGKIKKLVCNKKIFISPSNIYKLFSSSSFVITAVGVTLQELFKLQVPSIIISNYKKDSADLNNISRYSKKYMGKNFSLSLGHYSDLSSKKLINGITKINNYKFHKDFSLESIGSKLDQILEIV